MSLPSGLEDQVVCLFTAAIKPIPFPPYFPKTSLKKLKKQIDLPLLRKYNNNPLPKPDYNLSFYQLNFKKDPQ